MEIKNRMVFRVETAPNLFAYLKQNKISFEEENGIVVCEIYESDCHWKSISKILTQDKVFRTFETEFSKEELKNAEWLYMRSQWRFGYPQPEDDFGYKNITYTRNNCCDACGCGLIQKKPFLIKKTPNWGRRCIGELDWVSDAMFVNERAKSVFEMEKISGISFWEVMNKTGSEPLWGIYQLKIETELENGLISEGRRVRERVRCEDCGTIKNLTNGAGVFKFQKQIFDNKPDIVLSGDWFGADKYATKIILVKQRVYQMLVEHKLDKSLVFEPINLET